MLKYVEKKIQSCEVIQNEGFKVDGKRSRRGYQENGDKVIEYGVKEKDSSTSETTPNTVSEESELGKLGILSSKRTEQL